ncbi:MAG: hypothetical protein R2877_07970 [Bdellovibrionota bacterium]
MISEKSFDQRQWIRGKLSHSDCPDTLILGSSTVGAFSQKMFNAKILNAWLTGPSIEDFEAISQMLNETQCHPQNIVVGIDPWFFNRLSISDRWKSIHEYYSKYQLDDSKLKTIWWNSMQTWSKFKDNLSFSTTQMSFQILMTRGTHQDAEPELLQSNIQSICNGSTKTPLLTENSYLRAFDGHYENCHQYLPSQEKVGEISRTYLQRNMHNMAEWHEINENVMDRLEILLSKFSSTGSKVTLLSPPYHPVAFTVLMSDRFTKKNLHEMDNSLLERMKHLGVSYLNFRNSQSIPCNETEFNDSHHSDEACSARIAALVQQNF